MASFGGRSCGLDVANIGTTGEEIKRPVSLFLATRRNLWGAMNQRPPETLDDLLAEVIAGRRLTAWSREAGIRPWTLKRLRQGVGEPHTGTVVALARKLRVSEERVRAAIAASRQRP